MNVEYKNKILYVEVPNKLVGSKIMDFESDIIPLILCLKIKNVILNFEKTNLTNRKGVNSIIKVSQAVKRNDGRIVLCNLSRYINNYFKRTEIYDYCFRTTNYESSLEVLKI